MAKKPTKTQTKRLLESIWSKTNNLWNNTEYISTKDMLAITRIIEKNLKALK